MDPTDRSHPIVTLYTWFGAFTFATLVTVILIVTPCMCCKRECAMYMVTLYMTFGAFRFATLVTINIIVTPYVCSKFIYELQMRMRHTIYMQEKKKSLYVYICSVRVSITDMNAPYHIQKVKKYIYSDYMYIYIYIYIESQI